MPDERVSTNEKKIAVLETEMKFMRESLIRIESNHLVHINDELRRINEAVGALKIIDAETRPGNTLFWEIVKVVIMAVVAAGLALVIKSN